MPAKIYFVDIFKIDENFHQIKIGTFKFMEEPREVTIDGQDNPMIRNCVFEGIFDYKYSQPRRLFPSNGLVFLENLKYHFRSGYLSASDVKTNLVDAGECL
jgi:hypothetical protein